MKISIITATWNSGATLRDTLESILGQTYDDFEVIIKDGGSTDNTKDIVDEYIPLFNGKLKWHSEKDKGLYDAMNKGIQLATGDVIGILNSDDFYSSDDVLEKVVEQIPDVDAVYGDIHFVKDKNLDRPIRNYSSEKFNRWKMLFGYMPAHPSFYCRKSVYLEKGMFDTSFKIGADFDQLFNLIYVNRIRTLYIKKDFVTMRVGGVSTSGWHSHVQKIMDHYKTYKKHGKRWAICLDLTRYPAKLVSMWLFRMRHLRD